MPLQVENTKLVIITSVPHYEVGGQLYAGGPYTREIEPWAGLFNKVLIAAPFRSGPPPSDRLSFLSRNISVLPQKETGGEKFIDKIQGILNIPRHLLNLSRAMQKGDVIQVRCPCNLGVLGVFLAPLFSKYVIANYAGQWNGFAGEPISSRIQRFILRSWWWRKGLVTVYGEWPNQPRQIIPFFTSTMTAKQVQCGIEAACNKRLTLPVQILFVGRLEIGKSVDVLLRAVGLLLKQSIPFRLSIVGDGEERERLSQLVELLELEKHVEFIGALPYDEVMGWYEKSHVLVLASRSEGWGKVLLEAMCYGVVCVATNTGPIPWMLKNRGFVVPYGDIEALATRLRGIVEDPTMFESLSKAASDWARNSNYSIEGVQAALSRLLEERWGYGLRK
jgi:glycosyltransferase involved in cell wall biosynthesis